MFGLSRKKRPAQPTLPAETPLAVAASADEVYATLHESFRALEIATLTFDSIAHCLGEARLLARSAARPDGASQRGLIAARYAFLKEEIERRAAEPMLANGEAIAIALGSDEDGGQSRHLAHMLPDCAFKTAEEARALAAAMDEALRAVDGDSARIREAAGHIADRIANAAALPKAEAQTPIAPSADKFPAPRRRRAA